jgi:tetratricopeptide (TPR) repeat protein
MRLTWLAAAVLLVDPCGLAAAQTAPSAPPAAASQAYYEFLMARRAESEGDMKGALAALDRAQALDPNSPELHAERAAFHARQNEGEAAKREAERALALDPANVEGHRILGLVFASWAETGPPAGTPDSADTLRKKAIEHFNAIRKSPEMATDVSLQISMGRVLLRSGQTDEAVTVLETVVNQAPYIAEPFVLIAEARTQQGRLADAAEALANAAEINPRYYVSLGDLYERQDRWDAAAEAYGRAVATIRNPSRDLRMRWVTALLNAGGSSAAKAKDVLTGLLKQTPDDPRLLYMLSSASREMGDAKGAEEAARKLMAVDPSSLSGLSALSQSLSSRYAYRQVVELLTPFAKDPSRSKGRETEGASLLVQLGVAQQQLADYDGAIATFTAARALAPTVPTFDMYLAQALLAARRFDRAEATARAALGRDASDVALLRLRAQALSRLGRHDEAIALLQDAAKTSAHSPQLALGLADAYASAKRYDEAVSVVKQAETKFGEDQALTLRLSGLYEEAGKLPDAERELRRLLERDPLDATVLNYLGYLLADNGEKLPEAQELIERALKIEPDNPAYLDSLGWALFKQGKVDDAVTHLTRAASALPGNSVIQDHLGDGLARQGKWTDAVSAWERALSGDGDSIDTAVLDKKLRDARRRR